MTIPRRIRPFVALTVVAGSLFTLAACADDSADSAPVPEHGTLTIDEATDSPTGAITEDNTVTAFDTDLPAIANLDPALLAAVQAATTDAQADGFEMYVNSGWRSAAYQQELLDEAVTNYGSVEEARRWVNTPELSTHVTGEAVDVGPTDAMSWMQQHGSDYGLCQTYANEMWHFELAIEPGGVCPAPISDASVDHERPRTPDGMVRPAR